MTTVQPYRDRRSAGRALAKTLQPVPWPADAQVLALPRGGVPVAFEVARALQRPLDVFVVRKIGLPGNPELAMGALASGAPPILDRALIASARVSEKDVQAATEQARRELVDRETRYRRGRGPLDVRGRPVILIDDGLATGFTMKAAVRALREQGCGWLAVAVPVGPQDTCEELAKQVDLMICPVCPDPFHAVGLWYEHFEPTTDEEVLECLEKT